MRRSPLEGSCTLTVRTRLLDFRPKKVYQWRYASTTTNYNYWITGSQVTDSNRSYFNELRRTRRLALSGKRKYLPPWWPAYVAGLDLGTEFFTKKNAYTEEGVNFTPFTWGNPSPGFGGSINGPVFSKASDVGSTSTTWPSLSAFDRMTIHAKGTTAIARCLPTNPAAGLGVALGELREGIPRLVGSELIRGKHQRMPQKAASEYLNVEFGWKPLISDVRSAARAVQDSDKILAQYERDSGKHIRRSYRFPRTSTTVVTNTSPSVASPGANAYFYSGSASGTLERTRVTTTETWFSGCFTYFLSAGDTAASRMKKAEQEASRLLGLRLTPDLLYQLAPYSWLADWCSNLGDVIHNISAFSNDGLVMRWGYVMCTETITDTYRLLGVTLLNGQKPVVQTFSTTQKVRYKATPYGFGLDTSGFSTRQWAILAALGIARGPRNL